MVAVRTYSRLRSTALTAFALGLALAVAPATRAADLYVVSVGITNALNQPKLTATAKDARDVTAWARTQAGPGKVFRSIHVSELIDSRATKAAIVGALQRLRPMVKPGDYVLFYESSHGSLNSKKEFQMIAYDGALTFKEIAAALKGVAGTKITIFDACHSGEAATSGYGAELTVFSSSRADQFSFDGSAGGNSRFTQHFLAGLRGKADYNKDRSVTFQEAANYSAARLRDANKGRAAKDQQNMMWSVPTGTSTATRLAKL